MTTEPLAQALAGWALTLTEPLLRLRHRGYLEDLLARTHRDDTPATQLALAGFLADMARTLPARDRWRNLSARAGDHTIGDHPPETDGACDSLGRTFGTWRDAADLTPLVYATPRDDPGLAALAGDELAPHAAAILAAAAHGWSPCLRMIEAVHAATPAETGEGIIDLPSRKMWLTSAALHHTRESMTEAARWLVHRRRAYVGPSDGWPAESLFRWGWRASHPEHVRPWTDSDVARSIEANAITSPAPQDRPAEDDLDDF